MSVETSTPPHVAVPAGSDARTDHREGGRRSRRLRTVGLASTVGAVVAAAVLGTRVPGLLLLGAAAVPVLAAILIRTRGDAVSWLTLVVAATFLIPAKLVVAGPLKSAGSPALLLSLLLCLLWALSRGLTPTLPRGSSPRAGRILLLCYALASLTALLAATSRPLSAIESAGVTRAILATLGLLGVGLLAADAIDDLDRLTTLAFRVLLGGSFSAAVGIVQFFDAGFRYVDIVHLPFFVINGAVEDEEVRSNFRRVTGSAAHPIEFGVVTAMLLPLALHFALAPRPSGRRSVARICLLLLALSIPMAVSRGAILTALVGILALVPIWTWRRRLNIAVVGLAGLVLMRSSIPGLLGTVLALFKYVGEDPSTTGRTSDYARVDELYVQHPLTGLGLGTFDPLQYFYLDNQFLGSLLEGGIVLFLAFVVLLVGTMVLARRVGALGGDGDRIRELSQALLAIVAAFAAASLTFDSLGFAQSRTVLFLAVGMTGGLWRLLTRPGGLRPDEAQRRAMRPRHHRVQPGSERPAAAPPVLEPQLSARR